MKQTLGIALLFLLGIVVFIFTRSNNESPDGDVSQFGNADAIVLKGATQFDENHAFTRTIRKFEELVKNYYDGSVEFELEFCVELNTPKR